MSTEIPSIPIAPASTCCSDHPMPDQALPVIGDSQSKECCQDAGASTACSKPAATEDAAELDDGALIDALREVIDPELMINIVDLGLVYSINHTERKVQVEMTLTSPACPAGPQIISQAKMSLEKLAAVDTAEIKLTMSPPWTPDRMTDEARDQLGIF
jgi:metal-sulfur cluster biosynthetic enzyme